MYSTTRKFECYCCGELFDDWNDLHSHEQDRHAHEGVPTKFGS